jgi:penicillin-binding protein 1A
MLAALISSPSAYDPATNPEDAKTQRNVVLQKMRDQGTLQVSDDDYQAMLDSDIPKPGQIQPPTEESEAPYFTDWLRQQIVDKYGPGRAFGGGLRIVSTLDLDLQRAAEQAVSNQLSGLGPTASVVVIQNGTGNVLAMVGGQDFDKAPFNLATNGQRQPGSSFKPFTLVTALKEGHSPNETFESAPQEIPFEAHVRKNGKKKTIKDVFRVNNYDDNYLGTATIQTATTYSDNSVYAQLGMEVGLNDIVKTAHDLGISSRLDDNPAMILGGLKHGVTPLEMAYAYNTLANGGERVSGTMASKGNGDGPVAIEKVEAEDDNGDEEPVPDDEGATGVNEKTGKQVVDESVASTATGILHTVVTSGTGERAQVGDDYIWGKTGTTDNNADAWFVGANEDITVAVWVGYPDGATPMETEFAGGPVDGGTIPALIWHDVVTSYDTLKASKGADDGTTDSSTYVAPSYDTTVAPTTTTPAPTTAVPTEPAPVTPAPEETPTPPEQTAPPTDGGGGTSSGTAGGLG